MSTFTITYDERFRAPHNISNNDIKTIIQETKCWYCGDDINAWVIRRDYGRHMEPDYWSCNGDDCSVLWCDNCVQTHKSSEDDFYCRWCSENDKNFQACEQDGCKKFHCAEESWDCITWKDNKNVIEKVYCDDCREDFDKTHEHATECECGACATKEVSVVNPLSVP